MTPTGEFSHIVTVNPWPDEGIALKLTASADQCEALRTRFDLVDLQSLRASVQIERGAMELVLAGMIEAVVAQSCVVTLKPVSSSLKVPFERRYRRREVQEKVLAAGETSAGDEDVIDIEILDGDEIDVGEAVAEEFYLALDPYPRGADADRALEEIKATSDDRPENGAENPFAGLRHH